MVRAAAAVLMLATISCALSTPPVEVGMPAARVIQNAMGVFRQHNIPMLEMSPEAGMQGYLVSGPFDPRQVWSEGEVNARVNCSGIREMRVDSTMALRLDIRVRALEAARRDADDWRAEPRPAVSYLGRSRVTLESNGQLQAGEDSHNCTLTRNYALDLVSQITGQPIARTPVAHHRN